jgi:hypothetical protein
VEKGRRRQWRKGEGGSGEREEEAVRIGRRNRCSGRKEKRDKGRQGEGERVRE